MPRLMNKLTDKEIRSTSSTDKPIFLRDGGNLFIEISPSSKLWRLKIDGTTKPLGRYPEVSLADARKQRDLLRSAPKVIETSPSLFDACQSWHSAQTKWTKKTKDTTWSALETYVFSTPLKSVPISKITRKQIVDCIVKPFEERQAIERGKTIIRYIRATYEWAANRGDIDGAYNPARDIQFVQNPIPSKHFNAILDINKLREMLEIYEENNHYPMTCLANRFLALTAMRTNAIRYAEFNQMRLDQPEPVWEIPARIMKGSDMSKRRDFVVPLSPQAVEIVKAAREISQGQYLFESKKGSTIGSNTLLKSYYLAGFKNLHSPHGWRSSFSTYFSQKYTLEQRVVNFALAHKPDGDLTGIYNRAAYIDRRRELMCEWADLLLVNAKPAMELLNIRRTR